MDFIAERKRQDRMESGRWLRVTRIIVRIIGALIGVTGVGCMLFAAVLTWGTFGGGPGETGPVGYLVGACSVVFVSLFAGYLLYVARLSFRNLSVRSATHISFVVAWLSSGIVGRVLGGINQASNQRTLYVMLAVLLSFCFVFYSLRWLLVRLPNADSDATRLSSSE